MLATFVHMHELMLHINLYASTNKYTQAYIRSRAHKYAHAHLHACEQGEWINAADTCSNEVLAANNITARLVEYPQTGMQCVYVCHLTQFAVAIQLAPNAIVEDIIYLDPVETVASLNASQSFDPEGGRIIAYMWEYLSPEFTGDNKDDNETNVRRSLQEPEFSDASKAITTVSGLEAGKTYDFQVTVEDNDYARTSAVQKVVVKPWVAGYALSVAKTKVGQGEEVIVQVTLLDVIGRPVKLEHDECTVELFLTDGSAENGEHFVGDNQTIFFGRNESTVSSEPIFSLFTDQKLSLVMRRLNFTLNISNGTEAYPYDTHILRRNDSALITISVDPIVPIKQDIVTFSYNMNLTRADIMPQLSTIKKGLAEILGVTRTDVMLGAIKEAAKKPGGRRQQQPASGVSLGIKVVTPQRDGGKISSLLSKPETRNAIDALMPQGGVKGSLGAVSVESRSGYSLPRAHDPSVFLSSHVVLCLYKACAPDVCEHKDVSV
jgi:hypothetical protein